MISLTVTRSSEGQAPLTLTATQSLPVSDLVLNHAADLRQEVLADDAVEVAVLRGALVLDALRQADPLLLRVAHQGPGAALRRRRRRGGGEGGGGAGEAGI